MWFNRRRSPRIRDEIRFHRDRLVEDYVAAGMSRPDAERRAFLEFGNATQIEESVKDVRGRWLEDFGKDVIYALRTLRRSRVFAFAAILTLGLGMGANTALMTVTRGVLARTLPIERPDELVELGCVNPRNPNDACRIHYPGFLLFRERTDILSGSFAFAPTGDLAAGIDGRTEVVSGLFLSANAYAVLGLPPQAGRLFVPDDDEPGAAPVVVLSHQFWRRRFGGDASAIGRSLSLNNQTFTVIGVTPAAFRGLTVGTAPEVMLPVSTAEVLRRRGSLQARGSWWLYAMGRLNPGVSLKQAQVVLAPTFAQTMGMTIEALPADAGLRDFVGSFTFRISSAARGGISGFRQTFQQPLQILWGIVGLVLVIACVNLASLLSSRAIERQREFAVRTALGAGRGRLVRQVLTESLMLAIAGGILGVAMARWAASVALVLGVGEAGLRAIDVRPDATILAFKGLTSIVIGFGIGVGSVWRVAKTDPAEAWRTSLASNPRALVGRVLVASQIAIATVLVVMAVLFVGSLVNARQVDPGFDSDHLVTLTVAPAMAGYTPDSGAPYLQRVLTAIEALPGVRRATYHAVPIATGLVSQTGVSVPGFSGSAEEKVAGQNRVGPGFAEALGLRLIAGRDLRAGDETSASTAVVNESFSRHFYGDLNVLGRTFDVGKQKYAIVGVVTDAHDRSVRQRSEPWMYLASAAAEPRMQLTIRTAGDPSTLPLERAVQAVDPAVPVFNVRNVKDQIAETLRYERMLATFGAAFGSVALGLVAIGVYAMFNGFVSRRSREIAIRMALGGSRIGIARLLTQDAAVLVLCGLAVGMVGAVAAGSVVRTQLFNLEPTDGRALATAAIVMAAVVALAVWSPARRAVRIPPLGILRAD